MEKTKRILSLVLAILVLVLTSQAFTPTHVETIKFKVLGNCSMCKKMIESALLKNQNIKKASWDVESKILKVSYDPHMIDEDAIHKIVADAGYDTEKVKASDTAYKKLMGCCQYDRTVK